MLDESTMAKQMKSKKACVLILLFFYAEAFIFLLFRFANSISLNGELLNGELPRFENHDCFVFLARQQCRVS